MVSGTWNLIKRFLFFVLRQFFHGTEYNSLLALRLACIANDTYRVSSLKQLSSVYGEYAQAYFDKGGVEGFILIKCEDVDAPVVAFRGTDNLKDWERNASYRLKAWMKGKVHSGFLDGYEGVRDLIEETLKKLSAKKLFVTGHSLGGALATICALDLRLKGYDVSVYSLASPRVGNKDFAVYYNSVVQRRFSVAAAADPVTLVPIEGYEHVGQIHLLHEHIRLPKLADAADIWGISWNNALSIKRELLIYHSNTLTYIPQLMKESGLRSFEWFGVRY